MRTKLLFLFAMALLGTSLAVKAQQAISNTLPIVTIRAAANAISEAGATNSVIITRETTNVASGLTVSFSVSGTASNGVDYLELPDHVTIPAGFHNVRLPLVAIDDHIPESIEHIILSLRPSESYRTNNLNKITVAILDNDNQAPVVHLFSPTNNSTFFGPTNILLKAEAKDPDGWLRRVEFYRNGVLIGSVTNQNTALYQLKWSNAQPGNYTLTAKAVDNLEAKGSSGPVNIVIHQSTTNLPPFAHIISPTNNSSFIAPAEILITAHAGDSDGFVKTLEFLAGTNRLTIITNGAATSSNTYHFAWKNVPGGEYALRVKATDDRGATKTSEPVFIKVHPFHPPQPIVTIVATDSEAAEGHGTNNLLNTATFVISRRENTNVGINVYYKISGTASNGVDYSWIPNSIYLPPGKISANIVIRPIDDELPEETETVLISLQGPACIATVYPPPPECYLIGEPSHAHAVILDNDHQTNHPPNVHIVSPTNHSVFVGPVNIPIEAVASDADGEVVRVDFFSGNHHLGSRTSAPYSLIWSNVPPGYYLVTAKATDDKGAFRFAEPVKITVRSLAEHAFVRRRMPLWYVPGVKVKVQLRAEPRTNTTQYVVYETPPPGWTIQTIGDHGTVHAGRITFGPFNDGHARTFVYEVTPGMTDTGEKRFTGEAVANGVKSPILGATTIVSAPAHPADNHSEDWTITTEETEAYTAAWLNCERWPKGPNPIPVNFATRAGFLLESGGTYKVSTHSPTPIPPMLWIPATAHVGADLLREEPWSTNRLATAVASMSTNYVVGVPFTVSISATPGDAVKAYGLEESLPHGFSVTNISEGGVFCPETRKIRWGVYLDSDTRTMSYQLIGKTNSPSIAKFAGVISCNGINQAITGRRETRRSNSVSPAQMESIKTLSDGNRLLTFSGEPGVSYVLEGSADLVDWKPIAELLNSDGTLQYIDLSTNEVTRFYRALPRPVEF